MLCTHNYYYYNKNVLLAVQCDVHAMRFTNDIMCLSCNSRDETSYRGRLRGEELRRRAGSPPLIKRYFIIIIVIFTCYNNTVCVLVNDKRLGTAGGDVHGRAEDNMIHYF